MRESLTPEQCKMEGGAKVIAINRNDQGMLQDALRVASDIKMQNNYCEPSLSYVQMRAEFPDRMQRAKPGVLVSVEQAEALIFLLDKLNDAEAYHLASELRIARFDAEVGAENDRAAEEEALREVYKAFRKLEEVEIKAGLRTELSQAAKEAQG